MGKKRLFGAVESAIRIRKSYAPLKAKRRMVESVCITKATYAAAIVRLPRRLAKEAGTHFLRHAWAN